VKGLVPEGADDTLHQLGIDAKDDAPAVEGGVE
jgi:hypothetical protein